MQLRMKKLRVILSFTLLIEAKSITPKIIKFSGLLFKPVPSFLKSVHAWIPATTGVVTTHALSGATTEVKSLLGNQVSLNAGEDLNYIFYTGRWAAQSFTVSGLPSGLSWNGDSGSGSITGTVSQPGEYEIKITGYRFSDLTGSTTPEYTLRLTINESSALIDSDGDGVDDSNDKFPEDPKRASGTDYDDDGTDDEFDSDDDNDGVIDASDLYPMNALRASGNDSDGDGTDDEFDSDRDGDGVDNASDEFPDDPNRTTNNTDSDGVDSSDVYNNETLINNFSSISNLSDTWFDAWLGIFYIANEKNWIFHSHLGWLYIHPVEKDAFWFFDYNLGWLYTSKSLYPYFYRNSSTGWLYHLANSNKNRFWDYSQEIELE